MTVVALGLLISVPSSEAAGIPLGTLNTDADTDSRDDEFPDVATDGFGRWMATWRVYSPADIVVARSVDNGLTWTAPISVGGNVYTYGPRISSAGTGEWLLVWTSWNGGPFGDYDIFFSRSEDDGENWSLPAPLNPNADIDSEDDELADIANDGAGNWIAVWESTGRLSSTIGTDADILMSRSSDNGATWAPPTVVNTDAYTDSRADNEPTIETDGSGNWVVAWESIPLGVNGADRDIYVSRSVDFGSTWSSVQPLNSNAANDHAHDYRPQLAVDSSAMWLAVWAPLDYLDAWSDIDIFMARSDTNGSSWSEPKAINPNAATDNAVDAQPGLAVDAAGRSVVVWIQRYPVDDWDIVAYTSDDAGTTWRSRPLQRNTATDDGEDLSPRIATDGEGNWVTVWSSDDGRGTGDYDDDILYTTCNPPDDLDCDTTLDSSDNCPQLFNFDQLDTDADGMGDDCDSNDDNDRLTDSEEGQCGSLPADANSLPERTDTPTDDDGDTFANEPLPPDAWVYDCDGDGYRGYFETNVTTSDQDPCGGSGWPSDLFPGTPGGSEYNTLNIQDLGTFITPVRRFGTSPGNPNFHVRWDLVPGGEIGGAINLQDIAATVTGASGYPPMFGGLRAFGQTCPWAP